MSGAPRVRPMNVAAQAEGRPVLVPAGNKARSPPVGARKPAAVSKGLRKEEAVDEAKKKRGSNLDADLRSGDGNYSAGLVLRRQEWLLSSNLSLDASCSSDASTDSFVSRASTGRIGRVGFGGRRRQSAPRPEKILSKVIQNGELVNLPEQQGDGKRRCSWVTPNTGVILVPWCFPSIFFLKFFIMAIYLLIVLFSCMWNLFQMGNQIFW